MRRSTALCCSLLLFVTVIGTFHYGWSQEVTASITGTISDQSGAAVTGATVTATSQERGQSYAAVTNESGLYRIAQLPVGPYAIKVEKAGFALATFTPVPSIRWMMAVPVFALLVIVIGYQNVSVEGRHGFG